MNTFPLTVASPDGNLFHGEAVQLTLRGSEAPEDPQPSEGGENKPDDTETGAATGMGLLAAAFLASAAGVLCLNRRRRTH